MGEQWKDHSRFISKTFIETGEAGEKFDNLLRKMAEDSGRQLPDKIGFIAIEASLEELEQILAERGLGLNLVEDRSKSHVGDGFGRTWFLDRKGKSGPDMMFCEVKGIDGLCIADFEHERFMDLLMGRFNRADDSYV